MINICIVEDEEEHFHVLENFIKRYESESGTSFRIFWIQDGLDLVEDYRSQYDIILMDIQMKHMGGMTAAEKIRAVDSGVVIIFITSTVQYAVQGYAVDALGYVLKPVIYTAFSQLLGKACTRISALKQKIYVKVSCGDRQLKLDCDSISYIESQRNNVIIHTDSNGYITAGPLKRFEELLIPHGFSKCHNAYLVNLSFVEGIRKENILLKGDIQLPISRAKKKEFMSELTNDML